jgi:glutamate synthase domain-containing protein 2
VFADHVALPFKWAFPRVYRAFAEEGLHHDVVFIGSGKLGIAENALLALAMGCDMVNVGRTAMFSIGCIQAQRCHTDRCPTGVATQSAWLQHGLDPALKAVRCANYMAALRFELMSLARACGHRHPALVPLSTIELLDADLRTSQADEVFDYKPDWGLPGPANIEAITALVSQRGRQQ